MPLPDLIEIVPLSAPVQAEITVPGSKSITNRALVLAALADGEVILTGALWSEDTQVMVDCLQRLGFDVRVELDANEFCNRTITVRGRGGEIPKAGTAEQPLELFVGNAGTAARFLSAMVCLGRGVYRLSGVPRMHERPQAALFSALRELGYVINSTNEKLPVTIHGTGPRPGKCRVSLEESSQFASALLLSGQAGGWRTEIVMNNASRQPVVVDVTSRPESNLLPVSGSLDEELPYVAMTSALRTSFPKSGGRFVIEPDASSGSYFWAADMLSLLGPEPLIHPGCDLDAVWGITVAHWPVTGWQIDQHFSAVSDRTFLFEGMFDEVSRKRDLGDSIMTAIVLAPLHRHPTRFTDLGRLRVQECERVVALRTELTKCGAQVLEQGDTLTVFPSAPKLHGAEIETYDDHRMAMCFAVLGLKVPGIKLRSPSCVKKTFPNFFQKLAAAPPHGLGVEIRDGHTGRKLIHEELFAD
jgi:3-phosphoshikimate 1-carboxyvinyltransferase